MNYTPDYAVYLAERAEEREAQRFTYADAIRARNIALAKAAEAARYLETVPASIAAQPASTKPAVRDESPLEPDKTPAPAQVAARRIEFNRVVETLDNRGSLIDILL